MSNRPAGFNPEPLFNLPRGTVIDFIPPAERANYYLRGASLGALALNLAHGVNRVNPRDDFFMHVVAKRTDNDHAYAHGHAYMLSRGGLYQGHFNQGEAEELAAMTGRTGVHAVPGIIIGFPRATTELVTPPVNFHPVIGNEVPFSGIDPYSQIAISALLGVDVANMPLTPGVTRPIPPENVIVV
ncbi:MAG TPA: hypothetical protein VLF62_01205 [Candidatus Saccharimonadales bacterium]|nr:hypothetical protein [Candidatus Saccharimonadales bacterium]